ncbi:MAG TPA: hypothetical protein VM407_00470 [Acidovorax sp.]|nr:hypothetical protein [Acidovorax sp.]
MSAVSGMGMTWAPAQGLMHPQASARARKEREGEEIQSVVQRMA